jgi:tyrosine-protein kinase
MEIDRYIRLFRSQWRLILTLTLAGVVAAAALWIGNRPDYAATAELIATTRDIPKALEQAYEGERYAEERMHSYARVLSGPAGAQAVRRKLGLSDSVQSIEERLSVAVAPHSVVAVITASDPSAERAKAIANALAGSTQALIDRFESPAGSPPLHTIVTRPAELPSSTAAPFAVYLALGGLLGLIVAIGAAVVREALGSRVPREANTRTAAGAPVLGRIVERGRTESPVMSSAPLSVEAEAYRSLRASLLALAEEHERRVIAVSSAVAGEGKTEVTANLALAIARTGGRVAAVDANLRSPRLAQLLELHSDFGLRDVLAGTLSLDLALGRRTPGAPQVLDVGAPPLDSTELLDGRGFGEVLEQLADRFDWVLIDTPALLPSTDALITAREAGAVLLVAHSGSTGTGQLSRAARALEIVEAELLGVVLNRMPADRHSQGEYVGRPRPGGARRVGSRPESRTRRTA